jgi:hypothetical protein
MATETRGTGTRPRASCSCRSRSGAPCCRSRDGSGGERAGGGKPRGIVPDRNERAGRSGGNGATRWAVTCPSDRPVAKMANPGGIVPAAPPPDITQVT